MRCSATTSCCWANASALAAWRSSARRSGCTSTFVAKTTGVANDADDVPSADGAVSCCAAAGGTEGPSEAGGENGSLGSSASGEGESPGRRGGSQRLQYPVACPTEYKLMQPIWQPLGPQLHRLRCQLCCVLELCCSAYSQPKLSVSRHVGNVSERMGWRNLSDSAHSTHRPSCSS